MLQHRLSSKNFAALFDAAPDAIIVVDDAGRILFANRRTEELFGWSRDELLGQLVERLIPARMRGAHVADRTRYVEEPDTRPMGTGRELQAQRRDGTEFAVEISLSPLMTDSGMLVSSIIRDVSERRRLESDARRASDHLRSAVESIQDAFALFDGEDRLVLCNSTYREVFGRGIDGAITGRRYDEILDAAIADGVFDHAGEPTAALRGRYLAYHAALGIPLDVTTTSGRSLRIAERRTPEDGCVVLVWDLTDDVHREQELRCMQTLAEEASRAKSEFLSSMSHELRTPLNAVLGFAQLLGRDKKHPLDGRQRTMLQHVIKGGEHLLRLIDDVLDLSRIEAGGVTISTEPVRLAEVLTEVRDALAPIAARAEMSLVVEPVLDVLEISADRTRFTQILMNYGSNAIKYGRAGGTVTFRASASDAKWVRVTVTDDGIGIAAEQHERIFQPFQRAGQEAGPIEGTGIGLAITKRLARLMGGEVGFESTLGRGSTFWVDLPRVEGEPSAAVGKDRDAQTSTTLADEDAPPLTVVYVEDNPANVAFMQSLLAEFHRVELLTAPSAEIGVEMVRRHRPDAVIMDINLPGMSGFDATRQLRKWPETRDIPVIGLSAAAMPRDRRLADEAGFYRYLTKPVNVEELVSVLEEVLVPPGRKASEPSRPAD
jgi:PAS domain S-box-containing protein